MKVKFLLALTGILLLGTLTGCSGMMGTATSMDYTRQETAGNVNSGHEDGAEIVLPTIPEEPANTVILQHGDGLHTEYSLTVLNPYAQYLGEPRQINSQGAEALVRWLCTQDARDLVADFSDGLFYPSDSTPVYSGWISPAQNSTRPVRLMVDREVEEIGLLEGLLSAFEAEYGYEVELICKDGGEVYLSAAMGEADLLLAEAPGEGELLIDVNYFRQIPGFSERHVSLFCCPYVLCGPADDPAQAATCADLAAAFSAIREAECYFISRGDWSDVHMAEQSLWETPPEGDWYFAADADMGPCLVIAEEMGGYVLSDRLTYALFSEENGVIG